MPHSPTYSRLEEITPSVARAMSDTSGALSAEGIQWAGGRLLAHLRAKCVFPQAPSEVRGWPLEERKKLLEDFIREAVPAGRVKSFVVSRNPIEDPYIPKANSSSVHRAVIYLGGVGYFPSVAMEAWNQFFGNESPFRFRFVSRGYPFAEKDYAPENVEYL